MDFPFLLQADLGATLSIVGIQVGLGFAMVVLLGTILGGLIAWLISKLLGFPKPGLVTAFKLVLFTNLIMWGLESVLAIANALLPVQSGALSLQLGMAASAILSLVFGFVIFPIARGILYVYFAKKAYGIDLLKAILFSVILWVAGAIVSTVISLILIVIFVFFLGFAGGLAGIPDQNAISGLLGLI